MMSKIDLYEGDCLEQHKHIEDGSVDLILTDLPYGTMENVSLTSSKTINDEHKWDIAIEPKKIFEIANRILRKNGKLVLFSQGSFTYELLHNAIPNIPFGYRAIWEKNDFANCLFAKKAMVNLYEDVLVFSKTDCYMAISPLRELFKEYRDNCNREYIEELFLNEGRYKNIQSAKVHTSYKFGFNKGLRFDLMDFKMYDYLSKFIKFNHSYSELKEIDNKFKEQYSSTFNLWEGNKYKSNILKYKKDYDGHHPTQKPILLLEDLIKTFSNENDLVVDLTMGSGSCGVACKNTNRNFIGIEMDNKYFDIAKKRIEGTVVEKGLFDE